MTVERVIASQKLRILKRKNGLNSDFVLFRDGNIDSIVFRPETERVPSLKVGTQYLKFLEQTLDFLRPDVVVTYGGYWLGKRTVELIKSRGAKACVYLHNLSYRESKYFEYVDIVVTPSRYAAEIYSKRLSIVPEVAPPLIDWTKVSPKKTEETEKKFVLYVNPEAGKGFVWFIKIAEELASLRPDIQFLVVKGRGELNDRKHIDIDWIKLKNIHIMTNTSTPRDFYGVTKLALVPSLVDESFGRIAAEAIGNGIPTIVSDRGALPETVGKAGVVLNIPRRFGADSREVPTSEEILPWVKKIVELWDEGPAFEELKEKMTQRTGIWNYEKVLDIHEKIMLK